MSSFSAFKDPRQPEVHASTLLLHQGRLLSAWFGGTKEGHPDTKIWLSTRSKAADAPWSKSEAIAGEDGLAHWNPVMFHPDRTDRILLFYKVGTPISSWWTRIKESHDGGLTWSTSRDLVPGDRGGRGPVKNKPILLPDGTILAGASLESADGVWECFTDRSTDGGLVWQRSSAVEIDRSKILGEGAIQPSLIRSSNGDVTMLTRSSSGFVLRADSKDEGRSWSEMYEAPLFNNNSGLDAIGQEDGTWLVVHNPVNQRWGPRTPLVISKSTDEGRSWKRALTLEDKAPPANFTGIVAKDTGIVNDGASEFSYPAIISDDEGGVFCSYTYERVGIKHMHVSADKLK